MRLGIYNRTFDRPTIEENLDAVAAAGLETVQFDLLTVGLETLPDELPPEVCSRVRTALAHHN
ncbi:MAG: sugar phosphate isomerase/epimerase, partial [Candidatus Latescibacteria bacterium]|nr:sugar phosphate isomerase/epimerase [Candidatus Latescibacterota bacterium]